jgi:hypothetical protein
MKHFCELGNEQFVPSNLCRAIRADVANRAAAVFTLRLIDPVSIGCMLAHWSSDLIITAAIASAATLVLWWIGSALTTAPF